MRQLVLGIVAVGAIAVVAIALYANTGKLTGKADEGDNLEYWYLGDEIFNDGGRWGQKKYTATIRKQNFTCSDGWEALVDPYKIDVFEEVEIDTYYYESEELGNADFTLINPTEVNPNPKNDNTIIGKTVVFNRLESDPNAEYEYEIYDVLKIEMKMTTWYGYRHPLYSDAIMSSSFQYEGPEQVKDGEVTLCKRKKCKKPATSFLVKPAYAVEATPCPTSNIQTQ